MVVLLKVDPDPWLQREPRSKLGGLCSEPLPPVFYSTTLFPAGHKRWSSYGPVVSLLRPLRSTIHHARVVIPSSLHYLNHTRPRFPGRFQLFFNKGLRCILAFVPQSRILLSSLRPER